VQWYNIQNKDIFLHVIKYDAAARSPNRDLS